MNTITKIFTAPVITTANGSAQQGIIAETANGKIYCLFSMSTAHGFKQIAEGYKADIGRSIASYSQAEKIAEVAKKVSRKGNIFYQAV